VEDALQHEIYEAKLFQPTPAILYEVNEAEHSAIARYDHGYIKFPDQCVFTAQG